MNQRTCWAKGAVLTWFAKMLCSTSVTFTYNFCKPHPLKNVNRWACFLLFLGHGPGVRILRQGGAHSAVSNKTKHLHFTFYFYQISLTAQNTLALNLQACQTILRSFPGWKCKPCGRECPKQPKEKECVRKKSLSCFCWIKGRETRYFRKQAHWENSLSKCNKGRLPTNSQTSLPSRKRLTSS